MSGSSLLGAPGQALLQPAYRPPAMWRAWLAVVAMIAMFGGTIVPAPLWGLYRVRFDLSPTVIGIVFGVYGITVIPALPLLGSLSDRLGRRQMLVVALALSAAASLLFIAAQGVWWLVAARAVQAVSLAAGTGAGTAALIEWVPAAQRRRTGVLAVIAICGGGVLMPPLAAFLAKYAPAPLTLPFLAHLAAVLIGLLGLLAVGRMEQPPRPPRHGRSPLARAAVRPFIICCGACFCCYAAMSPVMSLVPGYLASELGRPDLGLVGILIAANQVCVTIGGFISRRLRPAASVLLGLVCIGSAHAALGAGFASGAISLVMFGGLLVGAGNGLAFTGTLDVVGAIAPADSRGATISIMYMMGYLGFGVPPIIIGFAAARLGLGVTFGGFAVLLLAAAGYVALRRPLQAYQRL